MPKPLFCVALALSWLAAQSAAQAQETDHWRFRQFQVDNDLFPVPYSQPGDRFYTNGIRVSLGKGVFAPGADSAGLPAWLRTARKWCPNCLIFPNFSFGQQMYTPEDLENPDPQPGEYPWSAWLYAGFGAAIDPSDETRHDVEVQIGVTGDLAGGKAAQRLWHSFLSESPEPRGWANQLGPDLGINGYYSFQHILLAADDDAVMDWDFVPSVKAAVGTMMTYAGIGGTVRIGRNITDFPYSPVRPSERRVTVAAAPNLEIYGFVGAEVRAVAYNYSLEGSLFRDEPVTVEPKPYVRDFIFGVTARYRHINISYAVVHRSEEFVRTVGTDSGENAYTSLSLTVGIR